MTNKISYALKVNVAKQGFWADSKAEVAVNIKLLKKCFFADDLRNFQVIMIDGNFTVITLCDRARLISFVMARERYLNVTSVRNSVF